MSKDTMIPAEAVSRQATIDSIVVLATNLIRRAYNTKPTVDCVVDLIGEENMSALIKHITLGAFESLESDEATLPDLLSYVSNDGLLMIMSLLNSVDDARIDEIKAETKANADRRKARDTELANEQKRRDKNLKVKVASYDAGIACKAVANVNLRVAELVKITGQLCGVYALNATVAEGTYSDGTRTLKDLHSLEASVKSLLAEYTVTPEIQTLVDLLMVDMEALNTAISGDVRLSDVIQGKSGIMIAQLPNMKPRSKSVNAVLTDTDKGVLVTFPKPMTLKYGTAIGITLGCMVPETTVTFKSEIFKCMGITSDRVLGTMLLLTPSQPETIKLGEGAELGLLVRR